MSSSERRPELTKETWDIRDLDRQDFIEKGVMLHTGKEDRFARTFRAKADVQNLWVRGTPPYSVRIVRGLWLGTDPDEKLAGAIAWTVSKLGPSRPRIANLQLLHTFSPYRRIGVAEKLCRHFLFSVSQAGARYYRVSAEPDAVPFYKKIGCKFLGRQKSGSQLAMAQIREVNGTLSFNTCVYDMNLPPIHAAVHKKGKGGCVEVFAEPQGCE